MGLFGSLEHIHFALIFLGAVAAIFGLNGVVDWSNSFEGLFGYVALAILALIVVLAFVGWVQAAGRRKKRTKPTPQSR